MYGKRFDLIVDNCSKSKTLEELNNKDFKEQLKKAINEQVREGLEIYSDKNNLDTKTKQNILKDVNEQVDKIITT